MHGWTRRSVLTSGAAALLASLPRSGWARAAPPLAILGGTVVDPDAAGPGVRQDLIVTDALVQFFGRNARPPPGATVVDARGKYLAPGLWDMHAHLAALNEVERKPEGYVGHGILAVRDMGGYLDKLLAYKSELANGRVGPALVFAGPTLNGEAFADFHRAVTTGAEARAAVRELKAKGVGLIKIHRALKPAILPALIDEAQKAGLPVAGHVPLGLDWAQASDAGMHIEHLAVILENEMALPEGKAPDIEAAMARIEGPKGDAIFARMGANRTHLDPTLVHYEVRLATLKPDVVGKARALFERVKPLVGRAHRAGVPLLAGTDEVSQPGKHLLRELELLTEGGLSPREALRAATTTAAIAARRPELGKIQAGAPASFLILDGDPTVDIKSLRRLSAVVVGGRLIPTPELARFRALDAPEAPKSS